jgi:Ran GTPase-activating protein (RanGAP) involved in mRNA processing and transport
MASGGAGAGEEAANATRPPDAIRTSYTDSIGLTVRPGDDRSIMSVLSHGHNSVGPYSHGILRFFTPGDATGLRAVHPEFEEGVAITRFNDLDTPVTDFRRWRAANPSAISLRLSRTADLADFAAYAATGALAGPEGRPGLQTLSLSHSIIRDAEAVRLAAALRNLPDLLELRADHNGIGDAGAEALAAALPSCRALATLNLSHNHIMDAGAAALAAALPRSLTTLDLFGNNHMEQEGVAALVPGLPATLQVLDLGGCQMGDAGAAALAAALPGLRALTHLKIAANGLTAAGLRALLPGLPTTLQGLCLDRNPFGPAGAREVAAALPGLPALQVLTLHGCHIRNEGIHALIPVLRGHRELTVLDLGESQASEETLDALVAILPSLPKLSQLGFLFGNKGLLFLDKVRKALPEKTAYVPTGDRAVIRLRPRRRERKPSTRRNSTRRNSTRRNSTRRNSTRRKQQRRESQAA